jgi:hypothetical protein
LDVKGELEGGAAITSLGKALGSKEDDLGANDPTAG